LTIFNVGPIPVRASAKKAVVETILAKEGSRRGFRCGRRSRLSSYNQLGRSGEMKRRGDRWF